MAGIAYSGTITLSFPTSDRARAVEWYGRLFGFTQLFDAREIGWTEISSNVAGVSLGFGEAIEPRPGGCVPVFGVADIAAARGFLESAGVAFDGDTIVHDGMVKLATFYDPDGNALMLAEDLSTG